MERGCAQNELTELALLGPAIFANFASVRLKTHKIGSAAKLIGTMVHLLVSTTQGLCSDPGHQSKGHHMLLS